MDLQQLIKHHRHAAEHSRRLHAYVATELHQYAVKLLEAIEERLFGNGVEGET
jgi:hypothetical protein